MTDSQVGLAGLVVGILGIPFGAIITYIFFRRSKRLLRLTYHLQHTTLIGGGSDTLPGEIEIIYRGKRIQDLRKCNVAMWNSGREPIRGADIVPSDPITIPMPDDAALLRSTIVKRTRVANAVSLVDHPGMLSLNFHYLDPGDGFNVEVLYSGGDSWPDPTGTVIGMKLGLDPFRRQGFRHWGTVSALILFLISLAGAPLWRSFAEKHDWFITALTIFVCLGLVSGKYIDRTLENRSPRALPKCLRQ